MEKVRNGVLRLPPGFRFHPTDEELIVQYLKRKVYSCPLPAAIIPEVDLAKFDPWELTGGCEEERYIFNVREVKYRNGNRANRAGRSGYWKATGKERPILCSRTGQMVGVKKVLVFYRGKPTAGSRTDYIMHEYQLAGSDSRPSCFFPQRKSSFQSSIISTGDWVLCRIFKKKRAGKNDEEMEEEQVEDSGISSSIPFIDFLGQHNRHQSSFPALPESSCVTELCDDSIAGEETSPAT